MKRPSYQSRKHAKRNSAQEDLAAVADAGLGLSTIDMVSLESMGTFMYFDEVNQETSRALAEFIIKSNFVFNSKTTLTILINSYGGEIYSGYAAIDIMETSRLPIQTVGVGAICSMASLIFTAGTPGKRIMARNAYMMTHQFIDTIEGRFHDFVAQRKTHDEMHNRIVQHYVKRSKLDAHQVETILLSGTDKWINAETCLEYGLCDEVRNPWEVPDEAQLLVE